MRSKYSCLRFRMFRVSKSDVLVFAKAHQFWTPGISSLERLAQPSAVQELDNLKDDIFCQNHCNLVDEYNLGRLPNGNAGDMMPLFPNQDTPGATNWFCLCKSQPQLTGTLFHH